MFRRRFGAVLALFVALAVAGPARQAQGAADVRKLHLVISAIPTQVDGGGFNDELDFFNRTQLGDREGLDRITFAWLFDAELRYLMRNNWAITAGVGQLRSQTKREYLPGLQQTIQLRREILSVPIHVGGAYYFTPYNQGDFQARAYLGGGFLGMGLNRKTFQVYENVTDTTSLSRIPGGSRVESSSRMAPGYYAEVGVHMFFAVRYSVVIGAVYRSAKVEDLVVGYDAPARGVEQGEIELDERGRPRFMDLSGVGARIGLCYGF
uniref:Outer membrane protein beta-barrel domain-containing protein n=1 Tax=Eiseniibacteriota bacterium TaxID=2212470 RepID=A0A832IAZ2_UNCEI